MIHFQPSSAPARPARSNPRATIGRAIRGSTTHRGVSELLAPVPTLGIGASRLPLRYLGHFLAAIPASHELARLLNVATACRARRPVWVRPRDDFHCHSQPPCRVHGAVVHSLARYRPATQADDGPSEGHGLHRGVGDAHYCRPVKGRRSTSCLAAARIIECPRLLAYTTLLCRPPIRWLAATGMYGYSISPLS